MSVMAETSQLAMGPYVAMAAVGSALYAWTAVCREALVVKVYCCCGEGDGGGGLGDGGVGGGGEGDNGMHTPQVTAQICWIWLHGRSKLNCSQLDSWSWHGGALGCGGEGEGGGGEGEGGGGDGDGGGGEGEGEGGAAAAWVL